MTRRYRTLKGGIATALLAGSTLLAADNYSFAVIGDQPYVPTEAAPGGGLQQKYPAPLYVNLINQINADTSVQFTMHIGDIKAGNTLCQDRVLDQNLASFNSFTNPVIYTPGDNEWTDCHRTNNGALHPLERLAKLRATFYPDGNSLGTNKRPLARQSDNPGHALYRENAKWVEGPVLFVTLHMPGSNNNHQQVYQGPVPCGPANFNLPCAFTEDEYLARNDANITWLNQALSDAKSSSTIKGVVIGIQANPFQRFLEPVSASNPIVYTESGYADFMERLRAFVRSSGLQVLLVNGDTHTFRINQPLTDLYPFITQLIPAGTAFMNFTRTEVFAQNNVHWTKVTVNPNNSALFEIQPMCVPTNGGVCP
ncbi:MAG: hypothetical protein ACRD8O_24530 [Bryobacteraceae bacterium]